MFFNIGGFSFVNLFRGDKFGVKSMGDSTFLIEAILLVFYKIFECFKLSVDDMENQTFDPKVRNNFLMCPNE